MGVRLDANPMPAYTKILPTTSCQNDVMAVDSSTTPVPIRPEITRNDFLRPRREMRMGAMMQPRMMPAEPVPVPTEVFSAGMA